MKIEDFAKLYPESPFALRYVERGAQGARKFVWHIMRTSDYFTSDTDRQVYDHRAPAEPDGFGDTPEGAIDDLLSNIKKQLAAREREAAEQLLAASRARLQFDANVRASG
jgi:hypothetical protein